MTAKNDLSGEALYQKQVGNYKTYIGTLLGIAAGTILTTAIFVSSEDSGKGEEIKNCPDEYSGMVEVASIDSLKILSKIAIYHSIRDSFSNLNNDLADKQGELACYAPITVSRTQNRLVLTPSGMDALDRGRSQPMAGELPDGLVWISFPEN
jgi:hypothetical protein